MTPFFNNVLYGFFVSVLLALFANAAASEFVWTGGSGDTPSSWANKENWLAGRVPPAGTGIQLPETTGHYAWDENGNWGGGTATPPPDSNPIRIPSGLEQYPVVDSDIVLGGRLWIENGGKITVDGANLILLGGLRGGLVVEGDGAVILRNGGTVYADVNIIDGRIVDHGLEIRESFKSTDFLPNLRKSGGNLPDLWRFEVGAKVPETLKLVNIAPYADIRVTPYAGMTANFVDIDPAFRSCTRPEKGIPSVVDRYDFTFASPQEVVRVTFNSPSSRWSLLGDSDGDGIFDRILAMDLGSVVQNTYGSGLARTTAVLDFQPAARVFSIRFMDLSSTKNDIGSNIQIYDFQILVPATSVDFVEPHPHEEMLGKRLDGELPVLASGGPLQVMKTAESAPSLPRGFHVEPWMFNLDGWIDMPPEQRVPLREYPPFSGFVAELRKYNANTISLWPPKKFNDKRGDGVYENPLLWPSVFDRHSLDENILKSVADAFAQEGILLMSSMRIGYPKPMNEFPESSRAKPPAPYIDRHSREYLSGVVAEQAKSGVAGVSGIGFDEQQSSALNNPGRADETTRKVFRQRFGLDIPGSTEDSVAFRKWVVFAYEKIAEYQADAVKAAKSKNPDIITKSPVHLTLGTLWNNRVGVGIAEDVVGHSADIDYSRAYGYLTFESTGHYVSALATKISAGGRPGGKTVSLHNCPWAECPEKSPGFYLHFPPIYMLGSPISAVMHGGGMPLIWRWNWMFRGGYDQYVRRSYGILSALESWGIAEARTPRSVAVLRSRASEDWWQIRQRHRQGGNPLDQTRGHINFKALAERLFAEAIPFDVYYLDHPNVFDEVLSEYDLVILPFAYSLCDDAAASLRKFAESGKGMIIFNQLGVTDEWGEPRGKPALAELVQLGNVKFIDDDLAATAQTRTFKRSFRDLVFSLLGEKRILYLNHYGNDVEAAILEKGNSEKFLALINWTDRPVTVDAGLKVTEGVYRINMATPEGPKEATLNGQRSVSAEGIGKFRIELDPWDARVIHVSPQKGE